MTPILGIIASSTTASRLGDFESIATVTVGSGGQANVEFTNIPQTYTHLQLRITARGTNATNEVYAALAVNGVAGTNYTEHGVYGDGSSALAAAGTTNAFAIVQRFAGASATADVFGTAIVDILDYRNTNKLKTIRSLGGVDRNGAGIVALYSSVMKLNTNAITSIAVPPNAGSWATNSHFALYGLRA